LLVSPVSFGWFLFSLLSLSKGKKMAKIVSSNVGALRTARRELITLRLTIKELAARVKAEKLEAAEAKRTAAIAKAEARLQKLLSKQVGKVGAKAAKANRKAGAVTVTKGA
jgi:hypothetical protein